MKMAGSSARTVNPEVTYDDRVADLKSENGDYVHFDDVAGLVAILMQAAPQNALAPAQMSHEEIHELKNYIETARREIAEMGPLSLSQRAIPGAADELDAIVEATREAADKIMDAADEIQEILGAVDDEQASRLSNIATRIYEASSFQDITGQRITKVVATLQHIEEKLKRLAEAFGDTDTGEEVKVEVDEDGVAVDPNDLLHGPQLPAEASAQDEIDALLASFD
jgi:chemotaxis protein CheZ